MANSDLILFLLQISVMLAVAIVCGELMRRLHLPVVLGELGGGILLGPTLFGALAPQAYSWLFPPSSATFVARDAIVKLGMLFFLFLAGLEMNLSSVPKRGLRIVGTSISGIVVPFTLGFASTMLAPGIWGGGSQHDTLIFGVFMGAALSISALPVIARILMDLGLMHSDVGMLIMGAATIDDLIGWSLFALILNSLAPGRPGGGDPWLTVSLMLLFFVFILTAGRWLGQRGLRFLQAHMTWPSNFIQVTAIVVLVTAAITEAIGTHAVLGAYLVGVALAQTSEKRHLAHETVHQFVISFFAPLYFVSIGLQANFAANFDLRLVLWVLLVASVGKIGGVTLVAWLTRMPPREALAVGFGLNARGAMEMILASISLQYHIIDQRLFVALIVMALGTSVVSGPMIARLLLRKPGSVIAVQEGLTPLPLVAGPSGDDSH